MRTDKLRRVKQALILGVVLSMLTGCANLFTGNLFQNFDGPPSATEVLGSYTESDGTVSADNADSFVGALSDAADSPQFYDDLSDSDREDLQTALNSVYTGSADTGTKQSAAILAGDVALTGTDAGETVNNIADVLTSGSGTDSFSEPADLLDTIIPASAQGDATAIKKILDDMVTAATAYEALGTSLTGADADGPDGANMTEVAQKAAVAIAVSNIVNDPSSPGSAGLADAIAAGTFDSTGYNDPIADASTDGTAFNNILTAGGLDGLFN